MGMNLIFSFREDLFTPEIKAEVSHHAGFLRFESGGSAYDTLVIHKNDERKILNFTEDSFRQIATGFQKEAKFELKVDINGLNFVLSFDLPDFPSTLQETTSDMIKRFVVLSVTARWLEHRAFGEYAKMVAAEAQSQLNGVIAQLRSRSFPEED